MQHLANTFEVLNFICYKNNNNLNDLCRDSTCLELDIINYINVLRFININCLMFQHILYAICLMTIQNLFRQIIFSHDIFPMKLYICPARNNCTMQTSSYCMYIKITIVLDLLLIYVLMLL